MLWTAGVAASPIAKMVGAKTDRAGRPPVGPSMNVVDVLGVFVVGDTASVMQEERPVPGDSEGEESTDAKTRVVKPVASGEWR